jgi:pyridoxine 5-phosphate synthase
MIKLGVNIDHIATLRQARKIGIPDIVESAIIAESAGADCITVHLREDRRHIQDNDVIALRNTVKTRLNLEMSINEEIVKIALKIKPDEVCIVPERRQELTTEGGLNIKKDFSRLKDVINRLKDKGITVSLFIDPNEEQIENAKLIGADCVELHTGRYADAKERKEIDEELNRLIKSGKYARDLGLILNAGHGLNYTNVIPIAKIHEMNTLNIGFSIVARAIFIGLFNAVKEMKQLIVQV